MTQKTSCRAGRGSVYGIEAEQCLSLVVPTCFPPSRACDQKLDKLRKIGNPQAFFYFILFSLGPPFSLLRPLVGKEHPEPYGKQMPHKGPTFPIVSCGAVNSAEGTGRSSSAKNKMLDRWVREAEPEIE